MFQCWAMGCTKIAVKKECKEEFARLVCGGMRKVEAYRQAFGKPDIGDASARAACSRLMRDATVVAKLEVLAARADSDAAMCRARRMELLSREAEAAAREGDRSGLVRCIDLLNKMDGAYEAEKVEVSGQLGVGAIIAAIQGRGSRPAVH